MGPTKASLSFLWLLLGCLPQSFVSLALILTPQLEIPTKTPITTSISITTKASSAASLAKSPSLLDGSVLLSSLNNDLQFPNTKGFQNDQVVRILDANSIKLQKTGVISLAGTRMPTPGSSNFQFPECLDKSPTYKLRQLVPPNTEVLVKVAAGSNNKNILPAVLIRKEDSLFVNQEVVRTGFGKIQKLSKNDDDLKSYVDIDRLRSFQDEAQSKGLGIFQRCESNGAAMDAPFEAQFEPLQVTIQTAWGPDGGKQVVVQRQDGAGDGASSSQPPKNPGDVKGCSDFETYEDALRWFEYYEPFYGDVAKLDRDGDGIPCPGLPHTQNQDQYRMKVPRRN